jgi:hypothetical protein
METQEVLTPVTKLSKDLLLASKTLSDDEARFLVDAYYTCQDNRKRTVNQVRTTNESGEPNEVLSWLSEQNLTLENQILKALVKYTDDHPVGAWLKEIHGVGAVLAAGLIAHIDIKKCPTVGHIWSFAGLDPTAKWGKGQKRPWNADLKVLCWKIGQSLVKQSGSEKCVYGHEYKKRKAYEVTRNETGGNAETAARILTEKNWSKNTETYGHLISGKLPPAQLDARARRYAVKLLLSDLHRHMYKHEFGVEPPLPYPISIQGHAHLRYLKEPK